MSLSNTQKDQLAAAGIAMFGVPMGGYSGMLENMLNNSGGNMQSVINQLAELPYFKSLFPGDTTAVATKLAKAYGFDSVTGGLGQQVKDFFSSQLNNGATVPQLIKIANDFLFSTTAPEYADTKALFLNKVAVANFYTYGLLNNSQDLNALKQAIANVGVSQDSVASAKLLLATELANGNKFNPTSTQLTDAADTYTGTDGNDNVDGLMGDDKMDGGKGNDKLTGGIGNDTLSGGPGLDVLIGGSGADVLTAGAFATNTSGYVNGKWVNSTSFDAYSEILQGGDGADTLKGGYGSDILDGGSGADVIYGDDGTSNYGAATADQQAWMMNDTIRGGDGADVIYGGHGTDNIDGGAGNDQITMPTEGGYANGGDGDDQITDSLGNDTILGGNGNDNLATYSYSKSGIDSVDAGDGNDRITWGGDKADKVAISGGLGDDSIDIRDFKGLATVSMGEGVDTVIVGNGLYAIDLTETTNAKDTIALFGVSSGLNDPNKPSQAIGFNPVADVINVTSFQLIKGTNDTYASSKDSGYYDYSGTLRANYVQQLNSPTTALMGPQGNASSYVNGKTVYNPDYAGKGIFLVTGASAAAADTATVAAFLNPYGNNATYSSGETHYFMVNIQNQGAALYFFKDDTGADSNVVADELTPQVMLLGVTTESLSYLNFG